MVDYGMLPAPNFDVNGNKKQQSMLSSIYATGTVVMEQYITNLTKRWIFAVLDVQLRRL